MASSIDLYVLFAFILKSNLSGISDGGIIAVSTITKPYNSSLNCDAATTEHIPPKLWPTIIGLVNFSCLATSTISLPHNSEA